MSFLTYLASGLLFGSVCLPLSVGSTPIGQDLAATFAADDECGEGQSDCAVSALQLKSKSNAAYGVGGQELALTDAIQKRIELVSKARKGMAIGVCVDQPGKEPVVRYAGIKDKESGKKAGPGDSFAIGSATKMFTAIAILQLAERGDLSLDDPVDKYISRSVLDDLTGGNGGEIKVSNLLGHTTGMGDYLNIAGLTDAQIVKMYRTHGARSTYSPKEIFAFTVQRSKPAFTLQSLEVKSYDNVTEASYSNTGYIVLGVIVEKASGTTFEAFVKSNILQPAEMLDTSFLNWKKPSATGYAEGAWEGPIAIPPSLAWSAGNIVSTPSDLARFMRSAMQGKFFERAEILNMWQNDAYHVLRGAGVDYGYGLMHIQLTPDMDLLGHSGQTFGFKSAALYDRKTDTVYAWNQNDSQLGSSLLELLKLIQIVNGQR